MPSPPSPEQRAKHLRAIFLALLGFALWVVADIFMKLAGMTDAPKYQIIGIGSISGMVAIFLVTWGRGELSSLKPKKIRLLAGLAILLMVTNNMTLLAVSNLPLANYYVVIFLSPALLAILSAVFLHERLSLAQAIAVLAGFIGVVIAANPSGVLASPHTGIGYAACLIGVAVYSVQILMIRVLGRSESSAVMACYPRLGPFVLSLGWMLIAGYKPVALGVIFHAVAMGVVGGLGWVLIAEAYKLAPVALVAPFQYSEIVFGALAGYLIWGNHLKSSLVVGATIIIASGLYLLRHTHQGGEASKKTHRLFTGKGKIP